MSQIKACQLMGFCGYFLKRKITKSIMFGGGNFQKSAKKRENKNFPKK